MSRYWVLATSLLILQACSDDGKVKTKYDFAGPDAAVVDDGAAGEGGADAGKDGPDKDGPGKDGPATDGPAPDQTITPDALVSPCNPGLDLKPLTLDPTWCVVYRFTLSAVPDAFNLHGDQLLTYALDKSSTPFLGQVQRRIIDPKTGGPGAASPYFSFTAATKDLASKVFATNFLARSASGFTAVAYTDSSFTGEIFWGDKGIKTPKKVGQAGNYDAVWLDNKTLLVNSTGIGAVKGQGVYVVQEGKAAWRLIKDLGVASGHMGQGKTVLFAGGAFGTAYENRIYGFTLTEIKSAVSTNKTLSAATDGDLVFKASFIPDATAAGDILIAGTPDAAYNFKVIQRIPVTINGAKVLAGTTKSLVTPGGGVNVSQFAGSTQKRLGLLLGGTGKVEIAVVAEK